MGFVVIFLKTIMKHIRRVVDGIEKIWLEVTLKKAELRKQILDQRLSYSQDFVGQASQKVSQQLLSFIEKNHHHARIFSYIATRNEVDLTPLMAKKSDRVYIPRVTGGSATMEFAFWDQDKPLKIGRYGIMEVEGGKAVRPESTDIALVPCVGLNQNGVRIGYGAGYYDRYFADSPRPFLVGVCFSAFCGQSFVTESHDIAMDAICSEVEFVYLNNKSSSSHLRGY